MKVRQNIGIPFIAAAIQIDKEHFDICQPGDIVTFENGAEGVLLRKDVGEHIDIEKKSRPVYTIIVIENEPSLGVFIGESKLAQSMGSGNKGNEFTISKPE